MSVQIENVVEYEDALSFNIRGVETCVVNSIRRTCLSNIDCLVLKGFPHDESTINIIKNTTNFNNEYLKHRLSCIPIMKRDSSKFDRYRESCKIILDVKNQKGSQEKVYVTTEDIILVDKNTGTQTKDHDLFPRDPISGDHILICILYPNHNINDEKIEELVLEAEFEIGCAQENSCWNVVHNCTYEYLRNEPEIEKIANTIEDKMERRDFEILDAQRYYHKNEYKVTLQSLGIFTNNEIIYRSCEYINKRLTDINSYTKDNELANIPSKEEYIILTTDGTKRTEELEDVQNNYCTVYKDNDEFFVFELNEDDYTIGKLIEIYLYKYYEEKLEFVGFKKNHPVEPNAQIYIRFKDEAENNQLMFTMLKNTTERLIEIFAAIQKSFISN
tara:strand:- start:7221 stop:8384 length:1164 start_codon:yes stop_codon:yes gene_type:complete